MANIAPAAVRHAEALARLGSYLSGCLGAYGTALLCGAYYRHQHLESSSSIGLAATTTSSGAGSCDSPTLSPLLGVLHRLFTVPTSSSSTTTISPTPPPPKLSLALFPPVCLGCAALLIWRSRPNLRKLCYTTDGRSVDTASLARLQREGKALVERAKLGQVLCSAFAVLFLWRMSTFHRQLGNQAGTGVDEWARLWSHHAMLMAGLGMVCGLLANGLHVRMQSQYRHLKQAVRQRVRAPTGGLLLNLSS